MSRKRYVGAIDQGTTSTRFSLFDSDGIVQASHQIEHRQIFPEPGWVEHDPLEIWTNTRAAIEATLAKSHVNPADIAGIGITNQRETTVVWDRNSGKPYYNAIVWQCVRTQDICEEIEKEGGRDLFRDACGLPISPYFSGTKIKWILNNVPGVRSAAEKGDAVFGNIDSWLIWWLTGGPGRGVHVTDVTNASRTMLMGLDSLDWDPDIAGILQIPLRMLPRIRASSEPDGYGLTVTDGPFGMSIPVCGDLGDQQAALFGQTCFDPGDAKNTYGTGCFLLMNTGPTPKPSSHGLITTVGYRIGAAPPAYCLEAPIAMAGSVIQWLRDNLKFFGKSSEVEAMAASVPDNGGVYLVPAFSGLLAPYWDAKARGLLIGLTGHSTRGHIARAALEATAYQTRDLLEVMQEDSGVRLGSLKVDGGMVVDNLLMQFQSDILSIPVTRPNIIETTSVGAAYAAGLAVGVWSSTDELRRKWIAGKTWRPEMDEETRGRLYSGWRRALERSQGWA
jgi:glycerol kinase